MRTFRRAQCLLGRGEIYPHHLKGEECLNILSILGYISIPYI